MISFEPPIYLDGFSTTPCDARVVEAMAPYWTSQFANAHSSHPMGRDAAAAVEAARSHVAALIGARAGEIIFTSGATEANALAIFGLARWASDKNIAKRRIVVSAIEHKAALQPCLALTQEGFDVQILPVNCDGVADVEAARALIDETTLLVSVQGANNELGTLQPVKEIAQIAHQRGAMMHCDGAQVAGKIAVDVEDWEVDLLTLSAHKFYGPKGVGALWARGGKRAPLLPLWPGAHEGGLRGGTLPTPLLVGMGEAARLARAEMSAEGARLRQMRDEMERELRLQFPAMKVNGGGARRVPQGANWRFAGVPADAIVARLPHLMLSTGAACDGGTFGPSPVLTAIGLGRDEAASSLRMALTRFSTPAEAKRATQDLARAVAEVESLL